MQRITGLPDEQVLAYEAQAEAALRAALDHVMDVVARRIERSAPVLASVLVAANQGDEVPADSVPEGDGLPPGQPYVSPDDLASIPPLWQQAVAEQVLPIVAQVFLDAAGHVHAGMVDASSIATLPSVGSLASEQYLARAKNTFEQIGDTLWAQARSELVAGFEAGESIPQLTERLRASAGVTARTGVLVARTQVIEASNAGSFETARASGLTMVKEFIATPDLRTRPTHLAADGQRVPLNEPFIVGGFPAMFPAAPTLPPAERLNCRCTIGYLIPDKSVMQMRENLDRINQEEQLPGTEGPLTQIFPKEEAPGFDLPARGENPPSYIRPSLRAAKTPRQLRRVWQDEAQGLTGFPFLVDAMPRGVSMVTAREYAEGTLQMLAQFPAAKVDRIHWFDDAESASYAQVRRGGHAIEFNMRYASETGRPKFLAARRRDVAGWDNDGATSWGVRNDANGQGVVYHEFTHILDIENNREAIHGQIVPLLIQHAQREGIADIDDLVKRRISSYAMKNYQEMVAEAGTDVMVNGAAASQLSRDIFDLVRAEYRRRGFEIRTAPLVEDLGGDVFPKTAAPRALSSQTVAQLRALAKERGITVPPGTRKADLVKMLEEAPPSPAAAIRLAEVRPSPSASPRLLGSRGEGLTQTQKQAVTKYQRSDAVAARINRTLREERAVTPQITSIDEAMAISQTVDPITTVYRGVHDVDLVFPGGAPPGSLSGRTWTDRAFFSTSEDERIGRVFAAGENGVLMEVRVPRGTHAVRVPGLEDEILLDRNLTFRVTGERVDVGRPGPGGIMPRPLRIITVEAEPRVSVVVDAKAAQRAAVKAKAAVIATQRGNAALIARIDELVQAKASKAVIRQELDPALREAEQLYAGADAATADALRTALDSGDAAKLRAALTRQSKASGLTPIGKAGAKAKFDPATMEGVGGTAIPDGADVIVVRRGAKLAGIETPEKAVVRLARAPSTTKTVAKGDFSGLTRTSEAMGGNPGGIFEAGDGSKWYVKAAAGEAQARSEALALDLYRAAGLDAPELVIGQGVEGLGTRQVATRFLDDAQVDLRARLADDPAYIAQVQDGFAVDAWMGNWDVVGANPAAGWDNIVSVAGQPVRIEAGGALRYRGLGGTKPFGDLVTEFDTLRDPATARRAAQVFESMTPEQLIASAERVRKVTPARIKALVKKHGLDPELADTLIARRADILRRADLLAGPKPLTPREYAAKIRAAAKRQDALDAAPFSIAEREYGPGYVQDALDRYRFDPSANDALRELEVRGPRSVERLRLARLDIRDLDRVFDDSRLVSDAELWRAPGSGRGIFGKPGTWGDDLAGFEWSDPAYSSTSASKAVADRFARDDGVRLRVLAPKGSRAIQLSEAPGGGTEGFSDEAEILLARGARYRVVKDRGWTEITHPTGHQKIRVRDLDVEVVVPDETPPLPWATK